MKLPRSVVAVIAIAAFQSASIARTDHKFFIDQYRGPSQCMGCHAFQFGQTPAVKLSDIHHSVHYRFESKLPENYQYDAAGVVVEYATAGKFWTLNGFPMAIPQTNWLHNIHDLTETTHIDKPSGCGTCHPGIGFKPYSALGSHAPAASEDSNIDCLICHALTYQRQYYTATTNGNPDLDNQGQPVILSVPRTNGVLNWSVYTEAARTVGSTSASTCLRCHAAIGGVKIENDDFNYSYYKRGVVFAPGQDVHASAGFACSKCHYAGQHKMKRPLNNDISAHDVVVDHQMCTDCHGSSPHSVGTYNDHTGFLSCTACHAKSEVGSVLKDYSVPVPPDPNDPLGIYNTEITFATPDFEVDFQWFDGSVGPELRPRGALGDGKSKIYPYKPVTLNQPRDAAGQVIPIKWSSFFQNGDLQAALEQGRTEYAAMWTAELQAGYGLPPAPGPFDHFATGNCGGFSISHGITKDHALKCASCHNPTSVIDFEKLGYDEEYAEDLRNMLGLPKVGDLNDDGNVDATDLIIFQEYWHGSNDAMLKALKKQQGK